MVQAHHWSVVVKIVFVYHGGISFLFKVQAITVLHYLTFYKI